MKLAPFVDIPEDSQLISAEKWLLTRREVPEVVGEEIHGWDYSLPLRLRRTLHIKLRDLLRTCDLSPDSDVVLLAEWSSSGDRRAHAGRFVLGRSEIYPLGTATTADMEICLNIDGAELAHQVELRTVICLRRAGNASGPLGARQPGSILWSDEHRVQLEGISERLPLEILDFSVFPSRFEPGASWAIEFMPDALGKHVSAAMIIYLNERFAAQLGIGQQEDEGVAARWMFLRHDIAGAMIEHGLRQENPEAVLAAPEKDTLAAVIAGHLRAVFPGTDSVSEVLSIYRDEPARFRQCVLQAFPVTGGTPS